MIEQPADLNYANLTPEQQAVADAAWSEDGERYGTAADFWDSLSWNMRASYFPDDQQIAAATISGTGTGGGGGGGGEGTSTAPTGASDDPYYAVEENRRARGGQAPPAPSDPAPEPDAAPVETGAPPSYDDDGEATYDSGSGGGSTRRRSSGGSSSGGGGGGSSSTGTAAPAAPAFPGGGFGTPNSYPTLPMTAIRRQTLENLSGAFGPGVGQFRTPPGGWREDMAPMFTTGAFGGVGASAPEQAAAPARAPQFQMPAMPAMGGGIPGGPPAASDPNAAPPLPNPAEMPPDAMMGLMPQMPQQAGGAMPPTFSQPGFAAPGSFYDLQMQRARPQQPAGGNMAPLPASLRQRFGL